MILSSLEMQTSFIHTKVYYNFFYSVRKETSHKPLKVASAKNSFSTVYIIDESFFDECFLFHVITERHYFLYKFIVTQRFSTIAMLLRFLRQVFWKKCVVCICYLHNNFITLLITKAQNKASTSKMFVRNFICS